MKGDVSELSRSAGKGGIVTSQNLLCGGQGIEVDDRSPDARKAVAVAGSVLLYDAFAEAFGQTLF